MSIITLGNDLNEYNLGFHVRENYLYKSPRGLSESVVKMISSQKQEADWLCDFRLKAYAIFQKKSLPGWGGDLSDIDFSNIYYYIKPTAKKALSWEELPIEIKTTYDKIGIPEAEKKYLSGVSAQYESEVVYKSIISSLSKKGVIFVDPDTAFKKYPDIFKPYFGTIIPSADNKFAALNSAVFSGGSFIYIPPGVKVDLPLQAYFRINAANMGQFERTLIIADEGSFVHYVEGCLPAGEQISLADKWVNVESVKVGDYVVDHTGVKNRVKAIMTRPYTGKLYKVTPISSYNSFTITPEHPLLSLQRASVLIPRKPRKKRLPEVSSQKILNAKPIFRKASELNVGDFLVFPKIKSSLNKANFSLAQLKFLGLYLAEGSAYFHKTLKQYIVSISLNESEEELINDAKKFIKILTDKKPMEIVSHKKHGVEIRVYDQKLYDFCLHHCGKLAKNKIISAEVMSLPKEQVENFVKYYFLGDGNICRKGNSIMCRASTVSENLARQMQELLAKLGYFASIQIRKGGYDKILGRVIKRSDQYIIVYTLKKKIGEVRETKDYFFVPIKKIEKKDFTGFVFNLEVEKNNSYLIRGFAVHNCTAPIYSSDSLHSAVVEIVVKKNARVRYTTIQNWSKNVYNLVTKRAAVYEEGVMEWVDANLGSKLTMKYPSVYLLGRKAKGNVLSLAFANSGQYLDAGAKAIHVAPETSSTIISKSISKNGGRTSYRGLLHINKGATGSRANVRCDALLLDEKSRSDTYPTMEILEQESNVGHEAFVSKISEEQLFYLQSRGLSPDVAQNLIVSGFIQPIVKELPMEYAVEMNRLIQLEMSGSVG